ncbi:hypothetical protein E8E13_010679 [Curvularia kusanoi]|uniref:Uncharacterized protein n=1 Tax=Curvularia kusanoi TaxID=90978 RepID=A0A9P4TII7_CURKU|nr:hypothetical protein E8E13_010679 [Curvularia kusanoi]
MTTTNASTAFTPSEQSIEQQLRFELHNNAAREADLQGRLAKQVQTSQTQLNMVKPGLNMSFEQTANPGLKIKAEVASPNPSDERFADGERNRIEPKRQILDVSTTPLQNTGQVTANNSIADRYHVKEEDTDSEELMSHLNITATTTPAPA